VKRTKTIFVFADIIAVLISIVLYGVPFYFVILNSLKDKTEAGQMNMKFPGMLNFSNYTEVIKAENYACVLRCSLFLFLRGSIIRYITYS
jgi:raffinose/stachyose/melibiose transport system permease protein